MTKEQKRYLLVFIGLFLMVIGGIMYLNSLKKKNVGVQETTTDVSKTELKILIKNSRVVQEPENVFVPCDRPSRLNYVYDENVDFVRTVPMDRGTVQYTGDKYLNNLRVVCGGPNCSKQIVTRTRNGIYSLNGGAERGQTLRSVLGSANQMEQYSGVRVRKQNVAKFQEKARVLRGNVVVTKGKLSALKPNTRVTGNLYIKNIDFIRIPKNFRVDGDVYVIDSEGVTFVGDSRVGGHIYVHGKSSIKAVPSSVKIDGQILV